MGDKKIAEVKETFDYGKFKKLRANRIVIERRKQKLIESFSVKSILNPIVINKYFEIIDGQGRFEARKELGLPIQYIMEPDAGIEECSLMNAYNTPWTLHDFIVEYCIEGNENYMRLKKIIDDYKIPISLALRYAEVNGRSASSGGGKELIMSGRLVLSPEQEKICRDTVNHMIELKEALMLEKTPSIAFQTAVKVMLKTEGYEPGRMIRNCKMCRSDFAVMSNLEAQLKEMSRVYNFKRKTGRIFFEDYMRGRGYNVRTYEEIGETLARPTAEDDISTLKERTA